MPLKQKKRHNPLMLGYFHQIGLPSKQLAERCGVSHSQMYMARTRNVGADNAEKISSTVARILGLSLKERLELKAEIMGHPGNLARAYFGEVEEAARILDVPHPTASEVCDEEKSITHASGTRALQRLRELGAPPYIMDSVDRRLMPAPEPRRGVIAHTLHGPEYSARRQATKQSLATFKPRTARAIRASGLQRKQICQRAGVGKETLRRALYDKCAGPTADKISSVLASEGASPAEREAIRLELVSPPLSA